MVGAETPLPPAVQGQVLQSEGLLAWQRGDSLAELGAAAWAAELDASLVS